MKTEKMKNKKEFIYIVLTVLLSAWVGCIFFYHLGESGIQNTDEARHIVNAYEMMKSGNIWINTYRYATDYYNFKPPFSMWCIMLNFKIFGVSLFAARLYAAISMFLLYFVLLWFLWKKFSTVASLIFGISFSCLTDMFFFHSARSADADATFLLFYVISMLLIYLSEKNPKYFMWAGLSLSLAFMTKCFHVMSAFAVLVFYFPRLYKKLNIKHYAKFALLFLVPTGIWSVIRIHYDGFAFFAGMMGQEVTDRVKEGKDYFGYLRYLIRYPVMVLCLSVFVICIISFFVSLRRRQKKMTLLETVKAIINDESYLFVLWAVISFGIYSASGAFMEWYSYVFLIPICIILAIKLPEFFTSRTGRVLGVVMVAALIICFCLQVQKTVWNLKTLKYECNVDLRADLQALAGERPDLYGARLYIENSRQEYKLQDEWEQNSIADAYLTGDFEPVDGGVPLFVDDQDALLIISKDLFPQYADILSGRVILVDGNDYLVFCNEFY